MGSGLGELGGTPPPRIPGSIATTDILPKTRIRMTTFMIMTFSRQNDAGSARAHYKCTGAKGPRGRRTPIGKKGPQCPMGPPGKSGKQKWRDLYHREEKREGRGQKVCRELLEDLEKRGKTGPKKSRGEMKDMREPWPKRLPGPTESPRKSICR